MGRSIIIAVLILTIAGALSFFLVGYDRGGSHYVSKKREERKSVRVGSGRTVYYRGGPYSSGGPRFGK
ncbi:MAG: hypothetical protein N2316_12975 [Spirochaetes bacterium]|nr:hypothetical protein [Spirochaetota bacterium]